MLKHHQIHLDDLMKVVPTAGKSPTQVPCEMQSSVGIEVVVKLVIATCKFC